MIETHHEWRQEGRRVPSLPQEPSFPDRLAFCIQPEEDYKSLNSQKERNDWESHPKSPQGVHESRHVVRNSSVAWKACSWFKIYTHIHNVHTYIVTYCNMFHVKYNISILNTIRSTSTQIKYIFTARLLLVHCEKETTRNHIAKISRSDINCLENQW